MLCVLTIRSISANHRRSSLARVEATVNNINFAKIDSCCDDVTDMETKRLRKSYKTGDGDHQPTQRAIRSRYSSVNCTCSAQRIVTSWNVGSYIQLRSSIINHQTNCPCADITERRFFIPNSFFRHAVHGSVVTYNVNGRYSFGQTFNYTRIVDEKSSPTFRLFSQYFEPETLGQPQRRLLPGHKYSVHQTIESLAHCFRMGEASPFDINQYGQTLFNISLQLFWALFQQGMLEYDEMARTIRFLTQAGVPLNEHGLYEGSPAGMISRLEENLMPRDAMYGDSKQLLLVKHFLSAGGDYEENDDFIQYRGYNLGCALFDSLPEFFEAANTSQASKAVMDRDLVKLERIINAGGDLDQVNTWGVGAVMYARNYAPALKMLLDAGAEPHRVSKGGWNPLSGSVAWNNYEAMNILLDADTAIVGLEVLFGILTLREVDMQLKVLGALFNRRSRLRQFALWHLTGPEWKHLELETVQPLDSKALEVIESLERNCVEVPASLQLYGNGGRLCNKRPEPLFALATMKSATYHLQPLQIEAHHLLVFFESIYSSGFHEIDAHNSKGFTPLLLCCSKGQWEAAVWILEKMEQKPPRTMAYSTLNALHGLAQYLGGLYRADGRKPAHWVRGLMKGLLDAGVQVEQTADSLGDESVRALCYCCPDGQTPTVTLAKDLAASIRRPATAITATQSPLFETLALRENLVVWSEAFGSEPSALEATYRTFTRQEAFNRLGITHTCLDLRSLTTGEAPVPRFDEDDTREIRLEEEELGRQLDDLMRACDSGREKYEGSREDFYRDWVIGLPKYLRECDPNI
jgi:hypothetical protein